MSRRLVSIGQWLALSRSRLFRQFAARRLAVLIDGDGISAKDADKVIARLAPIGRIGILRVYANFSGRNAGSWAKILRQHGVVARHMHSVALGKNAADIALTIEAIDLLHTRKLDTFVLVTSDTDFTPLAIRIREAGQEVIGFGQRSTPEPFRNACSAFHEIGQLGLAARTAPLWSLSPVDAETIVLSILCELCRTGELVDLNVLGAHLARQAPGFDSRIYSRRTLSSLLRDLPSVELVEHAGKLSARPRLPPD